LLRRISCLRSAILFRNSMKDPVNGLHVIFTGTRGALSGGTITVGPAGRKKPKQLRRSQTWTTMETKFYLRIGDQVVNADNVVSF